MSEREEDRENKLFNHPLWLTCCSLWENPKPKIQFINFSFELFFFYFGFVSTKLCLMVWNLIKLCSVSVCVCVCKWLNGLAAQRLCGSLSAPSTKYECTQAPAACFIVVVIPSNSANFTWALSCIPTVCCVHSGNIHVLVGKLYAVFSIH